MKWSERCRSFALSQWGSLLKPLRPQVSSSLFFQYNTALVSLSWAHAHLQGIIPILNFAGATLFGPCWYQVCKSHSNMRNRIHWLSTAFSRSQYSLLWFTNSKLILPTQVYSCVVDCSTVQHKLDMLTTMVLPPALRCDFHILIVLDGLPLCEGHTNYYRLCYGRAGETGSEISDRIAHSKVMFASSEFSVLYLSSGLEACLWSN